MNKRWQTRWYKQTLTLCKARVCSQESRGRRQEDFTVLKNKNKGERNTKYLTSWAYIVILFGMRRNKGKNIEPRTDSVLRLFYLDKWYLWSGKVTTGTESNSVNLLQYLCLGNSMDRGTWWATVHEVPKHWTWLTD